MIRDHKFIYNTGIVNRIYLINKDYCIKCNKNAQTLYNELYALPNEVYLKFTNDIKTQVECLNFYLPCLTDDEYLIKNIIE